jgi:GGDEF domain-containing protein
MINLNLDKKELKQLVRALAWNDAYGCFTRAGFEKLVWQEIADQAKWIIFFDVDDMGLLNSQHGYDSVNAIIKTSMGVRESDYMAGQWFSGDEFIICITDKDPGRLYGSNPVEFCSRLAEAFISNGASATFAVSPVISKDLMTNVAPAQALCQKAKANNRRGSINIVDAEQA